MKWMADLGLTLSRKSRGAQSRGVLGTLHTPCAVSALFAYEGNYSMTNGFRC